MADTIAKIQVPQNYELDVLAHNAGAPTEILFDGMYWEDGFLYVPEVTQEALDAALAEYDYETRMAAKYPPQPPTPEERIRTLEDALLNLLLGG